MSVCFVLSAGGLALNVGTSEMHDLKNLYCNYMYFISSHDNGPGDYNASVKVGCWDAVFFRHKQATSSFALKNG